MVEATRIEIDSTHLSVYMRQQIVIFVIEALREENYGFPFVVLEQGGIKQFVPYGAGHAIASIQEIV